MVTLSPHRALARDPVGDVVGWRTYAEMSWVAARAIIAPVQHKQAERDR